MVSLKPQGTRSIRAVAGGAGTFRSDIHIVEHADSIVINRQAFADEGNCVGLPSPGLLRRVGGGRDPPIERSAAVVCGWLSVTVENLHLVFVA